MKYFLEFCFSEFYMSPTLEGLEKNLLLVSEGIVPSLYSVLCTGSQVPFFCTVCWFTCTLYLSVVLCTLYLFPVCCTLYSLMVHMYLFCLLNSVLRTSSHLPFICLFYSELCTRSHDFTCSFVCCTMHSVLVHMYNLLVYCTLYYVLVHMYLLHVCGTLYSVYPMKREPSAICFGYLEIVKKKYLIMINEYNF